MTKIRVLSLSIVWLASVVSGFLLLGSYQGRPGPSGAPPARWPEGTPLRLDPALPTLLIFLHPLCPCSNASVDELAEVAESYRGRLAVQAILYRPDAGAEAWGSGGTIVEESAPGLLRWWDDGGRLGRRFGVETSGHVLFFDPGGSLRFSGGITPSRGHRGPNPGLEALASRVLGSASEPGRSPVFGCPILDPGTTLDPEASR